MNKSKRMIGMAIPLLLIIGALVTIDLSVYFDGNSALIVVGGAFGFMIAADDNKSKVKAFGDGAVYMGWNGSLIGWIAISRFVFNEHTLESIGAAFSVSLLTIFYGYLIKLVTFAFD